MEFEHREWFHCTEIYNYQILKLIEKQLDQVEKEEKEIVYQKITFMYNDSFDDLDSQKKICHYVNGVLGAEMELHEIKEISETLLRESLKHMTTKVVDLTTETIELC